MHKLARLKHAPNIVNQLKKQFVHEHTTVQLINANGLLAHTCFFGIFLYIDMPMLALVNVVSITIWLTAIFLTYKAYIRISVVITTIEVAAHATIATIALGLGSGFHLYLWPAALLMCIIPAQYGKVAFVCLATIIVPLLLLNLYAPYQYPEYEALYEYLHAFNLFSAAVPFIFIASVIRSIYRHNFNNVSWQANQDQLTGLINRRRALEIIELARAEQQTVCLALGDIDKFKQVNDTLGHAAGDDVLVNIAHFSQAQLKGVGQCCRWGGEEFLFIFIGQSFQRSVDKMEEVCDQLPKKVVIDALQRSITCSFGVTEILPEESTANALARADEFMYHAKRNGRAQVISFLISSTS